MTAMIKVYTASKLSEASRWRTMEKEWPEIEWVARWPFKHVGTVPDSSVYAKVFWEQDLEDIKRADVILVYAETHHKLRGALVEAGMAIALGKRVIVCGEHDDYSTWQHHPQVNIVKDLTEALNLLRVMAL